MDDKHLEYAVGLTREEYVRSQNVYVSVLRKKQLSIQYITTIILMIFCVGTLVAEYKTTGSVELNSVVILVLLMTAEIWTLIDIPRHARRGYELAYDTTLFAGHSFDGVITVNTQEITKRTQDETNRVSFAACTAYVETTDLLMFCTNSGKSIVIPARCLTVEDAELTKQLALEAISPNKRYILKPIQPQLKETQPIEPFAVESSEAELSLAVEYTAGELKSQFADIALRAYFSRFSAKMLLSVFATMLLYNVLLTPPLPLFLLAMLLFLVADVGMALFKAHRAISASEGDVCRLKMEITEKYLCVSGRAAQMRSIKVPWERITRAVESPKEVEFFVEKTRVITIPKRCIPDMEALRNVVDARMNKK